MLTTIRTLALSTVVALGALAAMPVTAAQADGVYLNFGAHGDTRFGVYSGDRRDGGYHVRRHRERDDHRSWRRGCSMERAMDKAERMGLRRARVVDANRRLVRVAGFKHGTRAVVAFENERGCPVAYF